MRLPFRSRRSAGIKVAPLLYHQIAKANAARDDGEWRQAALLYDRVLAARPDLVHIRVQRGHCLKESGDADEAEAEYRAAVDDAPADRDAALHLAHMLKDRGALYEAADGYAVLALRDPSDEEAMREARDLIGRLDQAHRERLADRLARQLPPTRALAGRRFPPIEQCSIVYDTSDLLGYFNHARRPTGIQRVQIETLVQALETTASGGPEVGLCCFIGGRDEWVALPPEEFLELARLSVAEGGTDDTVWRRSRDRLLLYLLVAPSFAFLQGAVLVNLGTSWWLQNYFLRVRDAQRRYDIVYIPMIYDMIPALFPNFCIDELVQDFIAWLISIFAHSNTFMAISEQSKRDLIAVAARHGHVVAEENVVVIPLDADFAAVRYNGEPTVLPAVADQGPFVLFVSTIEPRKGHLVAFAAWSELIARMPADTVPRLICVGRRGWRNEKVHDWLADHSDARDRISILADLSDTVLASLYEKSLFTIYPSLYEGWGLPVTEALCRGKAVITTTSSSLPEAGGDFAIFVPPDDTEALADAAEALIADPDHRLAIERRIKARFTPRSWREIADQIGAAVAALSTKSRNGHLRGWPAEAAAGTFYWLSRSFALTLRNDGDSGEFYRSGLGWQSPEEWGCRVKTGGGELAFRPSPGDATSGEEVVVSLRLVGIASAACNFEVSAAHRRVSGTLAARERLTVTLAVPVKTDGTVAISIAGTALPSPGSEITRPTGCLGIEGFMIHPRKAAIAGRVGAVPSSAPKRARMPATLGAGQ